MSDDHNGYHISFFRPTTPRARANRNIVIWLASIWAVSIFGFQILLLVLEKPTPEPAYLTFQSVWGDVEDNSADRIELQEFGKTALSVLGKIAISDKEKATLENALSWSIYQLTPDSLRSVLVARVQGFENIKAEIVNIANPDYITARNALSKELSPVLVLVSNDVRRNILPLALRSSSMKVLTDDTKASLPAIMEKYLIHNQSVLTDTRFLGFPFHYFYIGVFLLILFVGLCWVYCVLVDRLDERLKTVE
jgi:putative solute:sodium symporter small subunit